MKFALPSFLAIAALLTLAETAHAQILWDINSPHPITGISDIATNGTYVDALKTSSVGPQVAETIGDTTFHLVTSGDATITLTGVNTTGSEGSVNTSSAAYNTVLSNCAFVTTGLTGTISLNHLTLGDEYQVEIWSSDTRNTIFTGVTPIDLPGSDWALGTFTASGATQSFNFTNAPGSSFGVITAVALRDLSVPEPSTYAMMLGGLALLGFCIRRKAVLN